MPAPVLSSQACAARPAVGGALPQTLGLMSEPPVLIDGVQVLRFCNLAADTRPTGRRTIFVEDEKINLESVRALVVGENLSNGDLVLMHCTSDWKALACFGFENVGAAEESASATYTGAPFPWEQYRTLTQAEMAEVESTRTELEAWAAEHEQKGHKGDEA